MAEGLHRYQQTRNLHFITFSCFQRLPYLGTAAARDVFESALERARARYDWAILAYVVTPEHVHLLVNEPSLGSLSLAVQAVKLSVAKRMNEQPFWLTRYYDFNVWSEEKKTEKLRYIHRNPVKRGLATEPQDWKWSSYEHYRTGVEGPVEIESFWTQWRRDHPRGL